jgi:hypothetical protein
MKTHLIKTVSKIALVLVPAMTLSLTATAHDPKLHVKKAEKADCTKMDHSKMDMKDPVAIAMMKKCLKQAKKSKDKMDHSKMDHSKMKTTEQKTKKKDGDNEHNH